MNMAHARDQVHYSTVDIEQHVMCLWEEDYVLRSRPDREIKAKGDPAISPMLPIVVADIRSAWAKGRLSQLQREIVVCHKFWGMSLGAIAEHYGIEEAAVAAIYDSAIDAMIEYLGGRR